MSKAQHTELYYFLNSCLSSKDDEILTDSEDESESDYESESESEEEVQVEPENTYQDLQQAISHRRNAYNQYSKWLKEEKKIKKALLERYYDGYEHKSMSPWGCGCNDAINWSRKRAHYFVPIEAEPKKIKVSKSKICLLYTSDAADE